MMHPVAEKGSIDLLPAMPVEIVKKIEKKGKLNLFGVLSVFFVVFVSIVILGLNLYARNRYNAANQQKADSEAKIVALQYVELKQRSLNTKIDTFVSVQKHDFSSDIVLDYLMEVAGGLSDVTSVYVDDAMTFRIIGTADSYINVARLWHDMSQQEDYLQNVNLEYVRSSSDLGGRVAFSFSGAMIKENVANL